MNFKLGLGYVNNEEVTISDCEDDDDEESVAFNLVQRNNRFQRTTPMTEAISSKQTNRTEKAKPGFKVNKEGLKTHQM